MISSIRIERTVSRPIAVVRRRVDSRTLSKVVPEGCGLVWNAVKAARLENPGRHIAIYRGADGGWVDLEVGVELDQAFQGMGEVAASVVPAGDAAAVTHFGPYGGLGAAHRSILEWCAANGRTPAGTNWEVYGNWLSAWNADPDKIRTDIFYLLND
jgi:effector-binding domain-containing protein